MTGAYKVLIKQFQVEKKKKEKEQNKTKLTNPYLPIFAEQILQICSSGSGSQSAHPKVSTRTASSATYLGKQTNKSKTHPKS